jgi:uncharacterized protein YqgC (DUF456 family)
MALEAVRQGSMLAVAWAIVQMGEPVGTIALILTLLVMLVGLVGIVLPVVPGTVLIFLAALGYALVEGFQAIGWPTLVVLGVLTVIATTADLWASSAGAKIGGASGWSVVAGLIGGLLGLIVLSLPGAILGAILGVLAVEIVRAKDWRQALKAGGGWAIGWALSTVLQLGIGLIMTAIFVWQVLAGS